MAILFLQKKYQKGFFEKITKKISHQISSVRIQLVLIYKESSLELLLVHDAKDMQRDLLRTRRKMLIHNFSSKNY